MQRGWTIRILALLALSAAAESASCRGYCDPSDACWPEDSKWAEFLKSLDGRYLSENSIPGAAGKVASGSYNDARKMKGSSYYASAPFVIVFVQSEADVQKCMNFARDNNVRVTIQSSGHDFIGRSAGGQDSILINLSKMTEISANASSTTRSAHGEVTAEAGSTWKMVYKKVRTVGKLVVGGSAHTVSVSGYTMGGGHSPYTRMLGLAVDNLLEVRLVKVDGQIVVANENQNTDLFWALRGGGGGTYGVATKFTFKLHEPPNGFLQFLRTFAIEFHIKESGQIVKIGQIAMEHYTNNVLPNLPNEWGGYILSYQSQIPWDNPPATIKGLVTFAMLHWGNNSTSTSSYLDDFKEWQDGKEGRTPEWADTGVIREFESFWDYEQSVDDPIGHRTSLANSLVSMEKADEFSEKIMSKGSSGLNKQSSFGCTSAHIGGVSGSKDTNSGKTSINPALRTAIWSTSCGLTWTDKQADDENMVTMERFNEDIQQYGGGAYVNEPNGRLDSWKTDFWPGTYTRLLNIKKSVDQNNFLQCRYCVGYDLDNSYEQNSTYPIACPVTDINSAMGLLPSLIAILSVVAAAMCLRN